MNYFNGFLKAEVTIALYPKRKWITKYNKYYYLYPLENV